MKKFFNNINEEVNRIKSLFTEERLFGNLVEQTEEKTGCIDGDCQNGKGIFVYGDGNKYEGDFKDGKRVGNGIYTYKSSGDKYEGDWVDNVMNGKFTITDTDGNTYVGVFDKGKPTGKFIRTDKSGTESYGEIYRLGPRDSIKEIFVLDDLYKLYNTKTEDGGNEDKDEPSNTKTEDGGNEDKDEPSNTKTEDGGNEDKDKSSNRKFDNLINKVKDKFPKGDGEEENVLEVNERRCNNRIEKYLKRFEKNTSFLGDIISSKNEDNSEYTIIQYCITNFGQNYTGNPNLNRFLGKLGLSIDKQEKIDTSRKSFNILIDGKKVATLKRIKTYEYKLYGEENFRMIDDGTFMKNPKLKSSVYEVLMAIESNETNESLDKKIEVIGNDYKYPQTITFKINP